ncbi:MAG: hypothetical protein MSC31_12620 [Solirubrobacteraceae bacterium MAG38_C4-C5]|nr:hypothetical protein [Candidatus Siliceabacter maunaloa]
MSDWLVSPSSETDWRLDPDEFVEHLHERWPEASVERLDDADVAVGALDFTVPLGNGQGVWGTLHKDGQAVGLNGDVPACAEPAAWLREIVSTDQELIFWDQGYEVVVPLTPGITPAGIDAAIRDQLG